MEIRHKRLPGSQGSAPIRTHERRGTRILGELRKLGIKSVTRKTVKMILKEHEIDPGPTRGKRSWDQFLKIHADTLWQCDFLSKPMWTARGLGDVYLLIILHLGRRRVWISPSTVQPNSAWVSLQARNFLMVAEDMGPDRTLAQEKTPGFAKDAKPGFKWCETNPIQTASETIGKWKLP